MLQDMFLAPLHGCTLQDVFLAPLHGCTLQDVFLAPYHVCVLQDMVLAPFHVCMLQGMVLAPLHSCCKTCFLLLSPSACCKTWFLLLYTSACCKRCLSDSAVRGILQGVRRETSRGSSERRQLGRKRTAFRRGLTSQRPATRARQISNLQSRLSLAGLLSSSIAFSGYLRPALCMKQACLQLMPV